MMRITDILLGPRSKTVRGHMPALDGLRGIAVLIVVLSHISNFGLWVLPTPSLAGTGRYGVYLFFVLSSFLLTSQLLVRRPEELENPHRWISYASRRITRILPLYFFVLLFSYYFTDTGWVIPLTRHELYQHLMLQRGSGLFWTIPVEFKFYLVLPILAAAYIAICKLSLWKAGVLTIAVLALTSTHWWSSASEIPFTVHLGPYMPVFVCGSFAALLHFRLDPVRRIDEASSYRRAWEGGAIAAAATTIVLAPEIFSAIAGARVGIFEFHQWYLAFGAIWSVVLLGTLNGTGLLERIMCWRPLRAIGVVSFSVYLWHYPILLWATEGFDARPIIQLLVFGVITAVVSIVSYLLIERPISKLRWRVPEQKPRHSIGQPAAPTA